MEETYKEISRLYNETINHATDHLYYGNIVTEVTPEQWDGKAKIMLVRDFYYSHESQFEDTVKKRLVIGYDPAGKVWLCRDIDACSNYEQFATCFTMPPEFKVGHQYSCTFKIGKPFGFNTTVNAIWDGKYFYTSDDRENDVSEEAIVIKKYLPCVFSNIEEIT